MKKVLFVATVTGHINAFHIPYLKWFKEQGYEVHVATSGEEEMNTVINTLTYHLRDSLLELAI